jgi:hypothetical protein
VTLGWGGSEADDALQTDIYLERLLADRGRAPQAVDADLEVRLGDEHRRAVRLLADQLVRFHPSYRFEEALAARLRLSAIRSMLEPRSNEDRGMRPGPEAPIIAFPSAAAATGTGGDAVSIAAAAGALPAAAGRAAPDRRAMLIGGAIASGVSLAGAAIVAWRAAAPPRTAFGRATRAAHRERTLRGRA